MPTPEFWDFILQGGEDLIFPGDEERECECPHCGVLLAGSERVEWIDRRKRIFRCPECDEEIKL